MTLQDLEDYAGLRREISQTQARLTKTYTGGTLTHGTVKGSSKRLPYQEHVITVYGVPIRDQRFAKELEAKLRARIARYKEKTMEVEAFIDTLDDTIIRQIIALRYIDGLEWRQVAKKVYGTYNEDRPRKKTERFFKNK